MNIHDKEKLRELLLKEKDAFEHMEEMESDSNEKHYWRGCAVGITNALKVVRDIPISKDSCPHNCPHCSCIEVAANTKELIKHSFKISPEVKLYD